MQFRASRKLWGAAFQQEPAKGAEAFTASIGFDQRLWPYDLMGSAAHCQMLVRQGILPAADGRAILDGLVVIRAELAAHQLDLSPAWEDIHTRVEGRLKELIGEPAGKLPTARSRNDQVAADLRLFAREALLDELDALIALQRTLLDLSLRHEGVLLPGYTHLQRAQPILLAHHWLAYEAMFSRDSERLLDCYSRTDALPLGSGALAGVPYPVDRAFTAQLLGFSSISPNSIDAVADRDFVVEHVAALALVAAHLSRLAEELILWSSAEFGFVRIPEAYGTGSSIMPQKRNPDVPELVRAKAGRIYGHLFGLLTVLKALPLAYNKDLQEDKEAFFDSVDTALACLAITAEMLPGLEVDSERMRQAASQGFLLATDYADYLAKKGAPFREAHRIVGELVTACESSGRSLADLSLDELQGASPLFQGDVHGLTAEAAVAARDVPGGTAPSRVAEALAAARGRLEALEGHVAALRQRFPSLDRLLADPLDPP